MTAKTSLYDRVAVPHADPGNTGLLCYAGFAYYMNEDDQSAGGGEAEDGRREGSASATRPFVCVICPVEDLTTTK